LPVYAQEKGENIILVMLIINAIRRQNRFRGFVWRPYYIERHGLNCRLFISRPVKPYKLPSIYITAKRHNGFVHLPLPRQRTELSRVGQKVWRISTTL